MTLHPDKLPLLHALVDGELDAANIAAVEAHLKGCADCRVELARIEAVRDRLARASLRDAAPVGLRGSIDAAIAAEKDGLPRHGGVAAHVLSGRWASGVVTGALAASLALVVALPQVSRAPVQDELVQSHVRSLLVNHMVDIQTSNRHVVKPWFNGKIDFAPAVPDLAAQGFPLVGGRLDYVGDRPVPALVYRRGLHVINLFVRPARGLSLPVATRDSEKGYHLLHWTAGGLDFWAVSDVEPSDLDLFRAAYESGARS